MSTLKYYMAGAGTVFAFLAVADLPHANATAVICLAVALLMEMSE